MLLREENGILSAVVRMNGREDGHVLESGRLRKLRGLALYAGRNKRLEQGLKVVCRIGPRPLQRLDGTVI